MLTQITAGPYTIRGVSVGGIYTSLMVPELGAVLDVGLAPRSFAGADCLFLSHGHVDHAGGIAALLGLRALVGRRDRMRVYLPAEIESTVIEVLRVTSTLQRYELEVDTVPLEPGQCERVRGDIWVRAFRTYHPVPSLGYQFVRRVKKLREPYKGLPGAEIGRLRRAGEDMFDEYEHLELAYATDTLATVLDHEPEILRSKVLILECTFLDERKSRQAARAGCHIHLDDLVERAESFANEYVVLMHFSQLYKPGEVSPILAERCPENLLARIVPFVPRARYWPG